MNGKSTSLPDGVFGAICAYRTVNRFICVTFGFSPLLHVVWRLILCRQATPVNYITDFSGMSTLLVFRRRRFTIRPSHHNITFLTCLWLTRVLPTMFVFGQRFLAQANTSIWYGARMSLSTDLETTFPVSGSHHSRSSVSAATQSSPAIDSAASFAKM